MAVTRQRGAAEIIVTGIQDATLAVARQLVADHAVVTLAHPDGPSQWRADKGKVDLVFECPAAAPTISEATACLRSGRTLVQVGVAGATPMPLNVMVGQGILFVGSQRFDREFADAMARIGSGAIRI